MKSGRSRRALLWAGVTIVVAVGTYILLIRPWHLTWGATEKEVSRTMPGDEIEEEPSFNGTRAVTINARPEHVWPWIVQMGYKRAGFYSYDWLDNGRIASAEDVIPEYQDLSVGDSIPVSKGAFVEVRAMQPGRSMVWIFLDDGAWSNATWAWGLYEQDSTRTRLVSRLRIRYTWTSPSIVPMLVIDVFELVMMRKCLLGIKRRAEKLALELGKEAALDFVRLDALTRQDTNALARRL